MEWTLRELRYLLAVLDAGSFTDGAADLGVSQAAVSRTVAGLERRVGDRLVRRTPRGAEPTALGAHLESQARRVLAEVGKLDELVASRHAVLRLGYAWSAVGRHTTPLLRGWPKRRPDVELRMVRHNSPTAGLVEGVSDVAVVRTAVDGERFESVVIGLERRLAAFASDDPEWSRRRSVRMDEFAERTVVTDPRTGTTTGELWGAGPRPQRFLACADVDEWLDTIAAGRAVGTTVEATATHHPRPDVTYRPVRDAPRVPVHLAWWRREPPAGLAELVVALSELYAGK